MRYGVPAVTFSAIDGNFCIFIPLKVKIDTSPNMHCYYWDTSQRYSANCKSLGSMSGKKVAVEWEETRYRNTLPKLFKGKVCIK